VEQTHKSVVTEKSQQKIKKNVEKYGLTHVIHCITMKSVKNIKLVWDSWNKEHILKHSVTIAEVEKVFKTKRLVTQSYKERLLVVNKVGKRMLTIVLSFEKQKSAYVVSAGDSSREERRLYYENKDNKTI